MSFHPERDVRLAILRDLEGRGNLLTPQESLIYYVLSVVVPTPTITEVRAQLSYLEKAGLIVGVSATLGGDPKWKITQAGRAELLGNHV